MTTRLFLLLGVAILVSSIPASADIALADWCVNNNGSVGSGSNQPSNSCNGGTLAADPNVNISAFDTTLEPGANAVGTSPQSITVTFGTGNQNIGAFMNYDLDFAAKGSNGDYATAVGVFPAAFSYEMDNEFTSSIFGDFSAGALTNANNVDFATCSANSPSYCDVSWALDWSASVDPLLYSGGKITFTVSTTAPASGPYLQQTNGFTSDNLYLSAAVTLTPAGGPPPVPEPGAWVLLSTVVGFLFLARKRLRLPHKSRV